MRDTSTCGRDFWFAVFVMSLCVHGVFCAQAFAALATGDCMVLGQFFAVLFYPQLMTTAVLCPDTMANYGFSGGFESVGWPRYLKWLVAAYPASLVYSLVLVPAWRYIRTWRRHDKHAA